MEGSKNKTKRKANEEHEEPCPTKKVIREGFGRPRKYKTAEDLLKKVIEYYDTAKKKTMSGLALYMGFSRIDNFTLMREHGEDYAQVVDLARLIVINGYEERLHEDKCTGAIFALKALDGWSEKSIIRHETDQPLVFEVFKDDE